MAAHWRSSSRRRSWRSAEAWPSHAATASNRRYCSVSGSDRMGGGRTGTRSRQLGEQPGQLAAVAPEGLGQALVGGVVDEMAQGLHEGLLGDGQVLVAASGQHRRPRLVGPAGHLRRQPGLAHPGLPRQQEQAQLARPGVVPHRLEALEVGVAAHEDGADVGEQGRQRHGRDRQRLPHHLEGGHRVGQPLEDEVADLDEERPAGVVAHHADHVRRQDLAAAGHRRQPGRLYHRRAQDVAVLHAHLAQGQPHPHGHRRPSPDGPAARRPAAGQRRRPPRRWPKGRWRASRRPGS